MSKYKISYPQINSFFDTLKTTFDKITLVVGEDLPTLDDKGMHCIVSFVIENKKDGTFEVGIFVKLGITTNKYPDYLKTLLSQIGYFRFYEKDMNVLEYMPIVVNRKELRNTILEKAGVLLNEKVLQICKAIS